MLASILCCMLALAPASPPTQSAPPPLAPADLEAMLEPIALYPDDLLANILAASCYPLEVVKAARVAQMKPLASAIDALEWEPPVKAVAKLPDVIKMMSDNLDWTEALGAAFQASPKEVMAAAQRLRAKASENGALESGDLITVVEDNTAIIIESGDPEYIYVPVYDPAIVYASQPIYAPGAVVGAGLIGFGTGVLVGAALDDIDCDWNHGDLCHGGDFDIDRDFEGDFDANIDIDKNVDRNSSRTKKRVGDGGTPWQPNRDKLTRPGTGAGAGASGKLDGFRGIGSDPGRRGKIPKQLPAAGAPGNRAPRATPTNRAGAGSGLGGARPGTPSTPRSQPAKDFSRRSAPPSAAPSRSSGGPSGFAPSRGSRSAGNRGAASRGASRGGSRGGGRR